MRSLTRGKIELLVEKKLCGTITSEEQVLLNQWLDSDPGEQMIWYSDDCDELAFRERLLRRIKTSASLPDQFSAVKRIPFLKRYKWVAAAALVLLITGGVHYLLFSGRGAAQVEIVDNSGKKQDLAPGHNGAILTLSNGNRIVLDSTGNGEIAMQGNRRLVKKNGQLVYEKEIGEASSKNKTLADANIYNTMTTPRGREFQLVLSDGTKVWLNAASSITYPTAFASKERKVSVTGEVYFEVVKNSRCPFIVLAGDASITVLGTHFDVMAYPEDKRITTSLLEGSVEVSSGKQQVIITPGQQASFSAGSGHIYVSEVDVGQAVAWIDGRLSLDDLGIEAIMRKVSRWYGVDVAFDGPIPQGHFWGLINRDVSLSHMLEVMRANGINARFVDDKVIVTNH